jgi:hypothetical protein
MSLKDRLLSNKSSNLTKWQGTDPLTNMGATRESLLHADGGNEAHGYSTSGKYFATVNPAYQEYVDGVSNDLPRPSNLDMAGGSKISEPRYGHTQAHDPREGQNYDDLGPRDGRY